MTGKYFPKPGALFEERYRIVSVIGSGGFARVYLARDQELDREVALKILRPAHLGDPSEQDDNTRKFVGRFRREARLVAKLRDPHTITMFDHGQTDRGSLYMVTEFIDGRDLKEVVNEEAPLAAERVARILEQILSSLQEAHALGVLHRDIKPANIMLYEHVGRADQVKVLDFGIAKSVMADATRTSNDLTADGTIVGTPRYMAPEQLRGDDLGPTTDLYSVGLVAYELLCARQANDADSTINVITRQVTSPSFRLPPEVEAPEGLRSIVDGLLIKAPEQRFQTTDDVLAALSHWRDPRYLGPGDARPEATSGASSQSASEKKTVKVGAVASPKAKAIGGSQNGHDDFGFQDERDDLEPYERPTRSKTGLVAGGLLLVALLGAGVWFALQPGSDDPTDDGDESTTPAAEIEFASDEPLQFDEPSVDEGGTSAAAADDDSTAPAAEGDSDDDTESARADKPERKVRSARKTTPQPDESETSAPSAGADSRPEPVEKTEPDDDSARSQPADDDEPAASPPPEPTPRPRPTPRPQPTQPEEDDESDGEKQKRPRFFDVTGDTL
jgi:eukaryotic-like serine/threonine-protein kinase